VSAETEAPPGVEEIWTYIGRRRIKSGLGYFWLDAEGNERGFKQGRSLAVGGQYKQRVQHFGDGQLHVFTAYQEFHAWPDKDDRRVAEWTVADRAADEKRKLENRAARDRSTWEGLTLAELREQSRKLPSGQRAALASWITAYLWGTK
jgi:hypothetical protein